MNVHPKMVVIARPHVMSALWPTVIECQPAIDNTIISIVRASSEKVRETLTLVGKENGF